MGDGLNLATLHEQVGPIMRKVAQLQYTLWRSGDVDVAFKDDGSYMCNVDIISEQLLKEELHQLLPQADFYAEESGISGSGPYHWVIDPLDGTTNYVHGLPYFGVSVALTYDHVPLWGAIINSLTFDFFHAAKGLGSYINGQKLVCKDDVLLHRPLIIDIKHDLQLKIADKLKDQKVFFRNCGASALDQAYIARLGMGAVIFPKKLGWWDVAAGMLIITESGGLVTDFTSAPVDQGFTSYLAGSPLIHSMLLEILKSCSS